MVARVNRDDEAWMGQAPSRSFVPLLALAAAASAAIVLYAIGDWALAAGFAATVITIAALLALSLIHI